MSDVLINIFAGELVLVVTTAKVMSSDGEGMVDTNVTMEGIFADADDDFIYLSRDNATIESAVAKRHVVAIQMPMEEAATAMVEDDGGFKPKKGDMN